MGRLGGKAVKNSEHGVRVHGLLVRYDDTYFRNGETCLFSLLGRGPCAATARVHALAPAHVELHPADEPRGDGEAAEVHPNENRPLIRNERFCRFDGEG